MQVRHSGHHYSGYRGWYGGHHRGRHSGWHGGVRVGVGWGHTYYSYRPHVSNGVPLMMAWAWRSYGPRFVHYPPRVMVYPVPPIEQVIPEHLPLGSKGYQPRPIIKLKPGESIERGNVVIANIDGKIVILQAVEE